MGYILAGAASACNHRPRRFVQTFLKGCWFPVHAVGYNWLRSNKEAGTYVAERIEKIMSDY
ncbi:hypothetical protein LBW59_26115, partial [Ralstonia solanacearum]